MDFQTALATLQELAVTYGLRLLGALAIFIVGRWAAGVVKRVVRRAMESAQTTDVSLVGFVSNLVYYAVLIFAVVAALSALGVQTASFVAVIGAAGLAIGLALEGSLANFAAGVILLIIRPYRAGDMVELAGEYGFVEEIQIFNTILRTLDNKTIIIPNSNVTDSNIVNWSRKEHLRVDMVFGIGYDDDIKQAKALLEEIVTANPRILEEPAPFIGVSELADSSVNFAVRPYVKVEDYIPVQFEITEAVKLRFDEAGISIPYPQRDVHLFNAN